MAKARQTKSMEVPVQIPVCKIGSNDLIAALKEGFEDFKAQRGDLVLIGMLYVAVGLVTALVATGTAILPLVFPLFAGIALLGPLVATGFYELARRREDGLESRWWHFFFVLKNKSFEDIAVVGIFLIAIFGAWIASAALIYALCFGAMAPASPSAFIQQVLFTLPGWMMIVFGNLIGVVFAVLALAIGVVSLPLLVDRKFNASVAISTSIRAARHNPAAMAQWGAMVAGLLILGSIPMFLGLAVVLPVLGYATWHLYTKMIDRSALTMD